ncbi:MAG TPA: hypothetical protein VHX11_04535 [Acidobacteriaceae bacterium]|jgi:hypothetical protein|nr:hypothetical protein [Acidobacteriaceae bacterium]
MAQNDARTAEIAKIAETEEDIAALRQHLKEVTEGAAFKGSQRSGQFLRYIVEQSIAGHFESLKERVIGVELFGRPASYDTGDDAIVRVTASDVRRRLLQHYGKYGTTSAFHISLPLGSYIPEIIRDPHPTEKAGSNGTPSGVPTAPAEAPAIASPSVVAAEAPAAKGISRFWFYVVIGLVAINIAVSATLAVLWSRSRVPDPPIKTLPWSAFFRSSHPIQLITSDPNVEQIQQITGMELSLSDYANHRYIPSSATLSAQDQRFVNAILRGNAALVDTPIAVGIAELAQANSKKFAVSWARTLQLSDLQTDDNYILLGSPSSDPWTSLYADQLDFQFAYDKASRQEIIRNLHPRPNEQAQYVPTAMGWSTGQSYAIVALVKNPDQQGQVLLLGGANAEGTEAAGKLITDLPRLAAALKSCGISPTGPVQHFELLLKLDTMAGSPSNADVQACHILSGTH